MAQVSWSGSAIDTPENREEAYSPTTFPEASLSPVRSPEELFSLSVKIRFFSFVAVSKDVGL